MSVHVLVTDRYHLPDALVVTARAQEEVPLIQFQRNNVTVSEAEVPVRLTHPPFSCRWISPLHRVVCYLESPADTVERGQRDNYNDNSD